MTIQSGGCFGCGVRLYCLRSDTNSAGLRPNEFQFQNPQQRSGSNSHRHGSGYRTTPGGIMQRSGKFLTCSVPFRCSGSSGPFIDPNRRRELRMGGMIPTTFKIPLSLPQMGSRIGRVRFGQAHGSSLRCSRLRMSQTPSSQSWNISQKSPGILA